MKRLSHYLKNKNLNSVTLLTIFSVYVIFYYTLTYWGDLIPFELVEYGNLNYFLFGSHSLQIDILGLSIHNELVFGFLAFLISFLNFKFLHKKSLGLTTLSFPKTRAQLYNKRVALPVILLITSGLIAKTIALYWNAEFYGFSNELIGAYFTNVLILVQYILFGTALGIFGRVFTARTFEGILTSAGFLFIPKTIYVLIDALSPLFLHGYEGFYNNDYASFLDPVRDYIFGYGHHLEIPITEPVSYGNILYSAFWIIVSVISLFVLKTFFIKNTKYENFGINNKIPFITTITSAVFPLAIATFAYYGNTMDYRTTDAKKKEVFIIVTILALVFGYIINSIITKTVLFKKEKAIIISIIIAVPSIVTLILATGGLGYETRVPDAEKIEKITILPSLNITEKALREDNPYNGNNFSSNYNHYDDFLKTDSGLGAYTEYNFTNKMDFEKILALHNSAINNKDADTAEEVLITYELKDGSTLSRRYSYLSTETVEHFLELWETETVKNAYKNWLLNSEEIRETQKSALDFNLVYNKIPLSKGAKVTINSIDSVPTLLNELTDEEFLSLKTAIYNDVQALSWEEWFCPQKTYGNISFYNTYVFKPLKETGFDTESDEYYDYEYYLRHEEEVGYELNITVTSEMTNTIKCLEKLGLMDKFQRTRLISKAYLIDTEECAKVWFTTYGNKDNVENKASFYHSVIFDSTFKAMPITSNSFAHPYHNEDLNAISREVTGEELEALLEKATTKYYCSTDSDLLLIWTYSLTSDTYVISK
ncbi:MAG: hypothetical protein IKT89_06645 [Clostridia bacterium]|nr:hypothetical protein [Clostridia bacterium]